MTLVSILLIRHISLDIFAMRIFCCGIVVGVGEEAKWGCISLIFITWSEIAFRQTGNHFERDIPLHFRFCFSIRVIFFCTGSNNFNGVEMQLGRERSDKIEQRLREGSIGFA